MQKPTSSYLCSSCKIQLFTNVDIKIHEPAIKRDDSQEGSRRRSKQPTHTNRKSNVAPKILESCEVGSDASEVATIIDFKGSMSAKNQFC